jgi:PAS domain S-box-containing protein
MEAWGARPLRRLPTRGRSSSPPISKREFYRELWHTITAGRVWSAEIGNRSASGELYWLQSTIVPLLAKDGTITQFINISTDITQRKRLEENSRSQEQRLSIALSASSTGLWDHNPITDHAFYSDTWYTMLGYSPGELAATGETFRALMHPQDLSAYRRALETHATGSIGALEAEFRLRRKDRSWIWIKSVGKVIERRADGAPSRLIGVHIDISRERETQASLAAARDEAERANRAKTEFLVL